MCSSLGSVQQTAKQLTVSLNTAIASMSRIGYTDDTRFPNGAENTTYHGRALYVKLKTLRNDVHELTRITEAAEEIAEASTYWLAIYRAEFPGGDDYGLDPSISESD